MRRLSTELNEKGDTYWAGQVAIQGEEAGAWVAFGEHRTRDAYRMLRLAADQEDATEKHSVTPGAVRPARELLGDLLLELREPKGALEAYPKGSGSVAGAAKRHESSEGSRAAGKFAGPW